MKEEKRSSEQLHNMQQGQQPHNPTNENKGSSSMQGMNRESDDELLTTGGPVNRSSVEDDGDHGVVNAHTGGMNMEDEEANTSKSDFPRAHNSLKTIGIGGGSFSIRRGADLDEVEADYSQDKTEGIINPRSTIDEWALWKSDLKGGGDSNKGEGNTDRDAKEFDEISPV